MCLLIAVGAQEMKRLVAPVGIRRSFAVGCFAFFFFLLFGFLKKF